MHGDRELRDEQYDTDVERSAPRGRTAPPNKRVTPVTIALAAIVMLVVGFVAGAQYQKHTGGSDTGTQGSGLAAGGPGGRTAPGGQGAQGGTDAAGQPTFGEVAGKDGNVLTVTDASGNSVKVKLTTDSKVTRTANARASDVHPGDSVVVQGTKGSNGTITASTVRSTAKGVTTGGPGGGGGMPGGVPGGVPPAGAGATPPNGAGQGGQQGGFAPPGG